MKHTLSLTLGIFISFCSLAQTKTFTFKIGSAYELPRNSTDLSYFGTKKDGIMNLAIKKNELNILRFDPVTLEKTFEDQKELPEATRHFNGEATVAFGDNHFWVYSDWDKESQKEYLLYDKIDVTNGNFTEKNIKMLEVSEIKGSGSKVVGDGLFSKLQATGKYRFDFDADLKKMLVTYKFIPKVKNDKKNNDVVGFAVFDDSMKKLWSSEYTIPTVEQVTHILDFSIDSKGNVYMITKIYSTLRRHIVDPETKKTGYHLEITKFSKDSKLPQVTKLDLAAQEIFIGEASIMENALHEMIICCPYRKDPEPGGTKGVYVGKIDNQGNIKTYKDGLYAFPMPELAKFESSKTRRKIEKDDNYETPAVVIRNIIPGQDGSLFIAFEEFLYERKIYKDYDHRFYYFEDIYGMKIDAKGNMEWFTKIPKRQLGTDAYQTLGFKFISDKNSYNFLYIDNKKNLNLEEDDAPKEHINGFGGQIVVAKIDDKGKVTKEILFNPFDEKMMILPTTFTSLGENKFLGRAMLVRGGYRPILISTE